MLTKQNEYRFPTVLSAPIKEEDRPIIAGAGPAGYFAAIYLARI